MSKASKNCVVKWKNVSFFAFLKCLLLFYGKMIHPTKKSCHRMFSPWNDPKKLKKQLATLKREISIICLKIVINKQVAVGY